MTAHSNDGPGRSAAMVGLLLAGTAFLPIAEDTPSLIQALGRIFAEDWLQGIVALLLFGAPHLLGLAVAFAVLTRSTLSAALLRVPVTILYAELVLVSLMLLKDSVGAIAPWSLIGFTVVTTFSAVARVSADRRLERRPNIAWVARWGAMLVVGLYGWVLLQALVKGGMVYAPWVTLVAAVLLAGACRSRPR